MIGLWAAWGSSALAAAPTIDNPGKSGVASASNTATITAFAVGSGSNRLLVVGVSYFDPTPVSTVSTVVFNGTDNLTLLDTNSKPAFSGEQHVELWYKKNPTNATGNIVVTMTGVVDELVAGAASFNGVDQSSTFGTVVKNADTGTTLPTVTVTANANALVMDVVEGGDIGSGPVSTGTQLWNIANATSNSRGLSQYKTGAASVVMNWTTNTLGEWVNMGVALNGAAAVVSNPLTPHLTLNFGKLFLIGGMLIIR